MIQIEQFNSGHYEKGVGGYHYFVPSKVNDEWNWHSQEISELLQDAAVKLGELNSFARLVPNIDLFIQLHVTKEAVVSSKIEGTQTDINEALLPEDAIAPERREDWKEVNNYINALNQAIEDLETLPVSSRLLKKTHAKLLDSVRGENKQPGNFRKSQNWIGGSGPGDALFVPPHHDYMGDLMSDLETFLHNDAIKVPSIIRIAIAHYQFETIHPFLDGNGRIARLLITLYLVSANILDKPLLYLSSYFERDKGLYFEKLDLVRQKQDMKNWIKYFLIGIEKTASEAVTVLQEVLKLKETLENQVTQNFGRKANSALVLLRALFNKPVIQVSEVAQTCGLSKKAAHDLVHDFVEEGILTELTGKARNRVYVFNQYLNLYSGISNK